MEDNIIKRDTACEKAWGVGFSSGNDYRKITYLCVMTVSLAHDDWGVVGGFVFIAYADYFQLNMDETSFLCNEGKLSIIGNKG